MRYALLFLLTCACASNKAPELLIVGAEPAASEVVLESKFIFEEHDIDNQ